MSAGIAALVAQLAELTEVLRPVAERLAADVEISPAGRDTEPAPEGPAVATAGQPGDERADRIAGLRELADFIEAHPDLPVGRYDRAEISISVSNLPLMWGKDEASMLAEVTRIASVLGVEADLRDEPGAGHPCAERSFRGVSYGAYYVTEAYKRGYAPAPTDIPRGGEEVAGPVEGTGPATSPEVTHEQVAGWGGGPAGCGIECSCGVTFGGFDTIAEAEAQRVLHADEAAGSATAPEWTPGAGLERLKREMPGIVPELTDDDMRKADEVIAAAARPIVLVASPIPGGPPARAEVSEDKGGTTVKVVYCDSRTGARVARRRILGLAPDVEPEG